MGSRLAGDGNAHAAFFCTGPAAMPMAGRTGPEAKTAEWTEPLRFVWGLTGEKGIPMMCRSHLDVVQSPTMCKSMLL